MRDGDGPPPAVGALKRPKLDTVGTAKVSGRSWKQPEARSGSLRNPGLSSSWDKKMRDKAEMGALRQRKRDAQELHREAVKAKKDEREAARVRKEANRAKSTVTQRIKASTAKRMAKNKKLRKKLVTVE